MNLIVNKTTNIEYLKARKQEVITFLKTYSIIADRHRVIEEVLNGKNLNEVAKENNISVSRIKGLLQLNTDEFLIFSNRCSNALKRHGFQTVDEIREYVRSDISHKSEQAILEKKI